nr:MAG TPA: LydA holin phage, holin superfamily III [Caudoviricetes sp.]
MQDNGSPNNGIDIIATVISLAFSGLGGVVKYITATQSMGEHVKLSSVVSSFLVGAFSGMVVAFFLMSQSIDTLMIISIAGAFGYFGVPALWGLLRVFFRQIGGSVDDLRPDYSIKDIERKTNKKRSHRHDDEMQINSNEEDILIDDTEEQGDDLEPRSK